MADREKVTKGLDCCLDLIRSRQFSSGCGFCPYVSAEHCKVKMIEDAISLLKEQSERIAIMRESMETMERRLAAVECQPIEVKSTDQMVYVGWMHEDQKLGLSEEEDDAEKNLRPLRRGNPR